MLRCTKERWDAAQAKEFETWMSDHPGCDMSDDRNEEHSEAFDHYAALKGKKFAKSIEVGCGPFTNMRLIIETCDVGQLHLLDPLIGGYLGHKFCPYKRTAATFHNMAVEDFRTTERFNLVVMVNVLSHCQDALLAMRQVRGMMAPGATLVFHEDTVMDGEREPCTMHPLTVPRAAMALFLAGFEPQHQRTFKGLYGRPERVDHYFIGTVKDGA